ncbi:RICIN domain-containing protein [Streptomyces sp. NPDC004008]
MRLHSRTAAVAGGVVLACGLGMLPAAAASGGTAGSAMGHVRASSLASSAGNANQWWMWINSKDRCLDVPGWSTRNGTGLDAWDCKHQSNERWIPVGPFTGRRGHTVFLIENAHSGKCINDPGYSRADGTRLVQWTCRRSDSNSQWYEQDVGSSVILHNAYSGRCLNIAGASTRNGS